MVQGKVEICGVNTAKLPLLKNAEKEELFKKIEEGDQDARMAYINGNLRLVLSVIKRFHSSSENVDDLFQIGCVGLIKAIDNFDSSLNVKFSTYAVPMNILCRNSQIEKSMFTLLLVIVILFTNFLNIFFFCFISKSFHTSLILDSISVFSFLLENIIEFFVSISICLFTFFNCFCNS